MALLLFVFKTNSSKLFRLSCTIDFGFLVNIRFLNFHIIIGFNEYSALVSASSLFVLDLVVVDQWSFHLINCFFRFLQFLMEAKLIFLILMHQEQEILSLLQLTLGKGAVFFPTACSLIVKFPKHTFLLPFLPCVIDT